MWTAVHRQLPESWHKSFRPPSHERLLGVEWRMWTANSPCLPVVVWPKKSGPSPSWETVVILWGWVTVRGFGGHVFTAPRGTVVEKDGRVALQLTAEPLTTHVVVVALQWGAERPQPWRDPIARVIWRDPPTLRATIWSGGSGRHLPGALPWLRDCGDASLPPAEMRGALEGLYGTDDELGPRHHFMVATDHTAEVSDDTVALVADAAQCLAPHAMILPREGWEGQQHTQTPAALLIAQYVALGGSEVEYLDRLETRYPRHWTAHHLLAPNVQLTVDPLSQPMLAGRPHQWPLTWDMAVKTMHMAPRGQRAVWPGAENLLATAWAAQVKQPDDNSTDCCVCVHRRYPPPGAEAGQPLVHVGQAVGGGGSP